MTKSKKRTPKKPTQPAVKQLHSFSGTMEQLIGHLKLNVQATVPGMLHLDPVFRRFITNFLCDEYSGEVKKAVRHAA